MAEFKQSQIKPGVTKHRSNAVKVYVDGGCAANDILAVTGVQGDFMKVAKADADIGVTLNGGLLFVADYAAADGDYTPVALPFKVVVGVDTSSSSIGAPVYLSATAGSFAFTAGTVGLKVGSVLTAATAANNGTILLAPQAMPTTGGGVFVSQEVTANAGAQSTAHSLGYVPARVLVSITDSNATADVIITEGTHTAVNCVVTVAPSGAKYKILAM